MFLQVDDPTDSVKALKQADQQSYQIPLSLIRLTSPCYNNTICIQIQYKTPWKYKKYVANTHK